MQTVLDLRQEFTTPASVVSVVFRQMNPDAEVVGSESLANGRFYLWYVTDRCGRSCGHHEVTALAPWTFSPPLAIPAVCRQDEGHKGECAP